MKVDKREGENECPDWPGRRGTMLAPPLSTVTHATGLDYQRVKCMKCMLILVAPRQQSKVTAGAEFLLVSDVVSMPCRITKLLQLIDRRTGTPLQEAPKELLDRQAGKVLICPDNARARKHYKKKVTRQLNNSDYFQDALIGPHNPKGRFALLQYHKVIAVGIISEVSASPSDRVGENRKSDYKTRKKRRRR